jgi:2-dehydro-3-deoxygalactonokinase
VNTLLAIDWGTTNRRTWRVEDGAVVAAERDAMGVTAVQDFAGEVAAIRARLGNLPVLMAGMVGSTLGWRDAGYLPTPAGLDELAAGLVRLDARTAIVPGVSTDPADVMRGEEVQFMGALALGLAPPDALMIQPGTHSKWATLRGGRLTGFATAMTGELFALLRTHGILARQLGGAVTPGPAFLEGVAEGRRRDLSASLFTIRASRLLDRDRARDSASYASGLLIGCEIAARLESAPDGDIHVLADPGLGGLYLCALDAHGRRAHLVDSQTAFVAGITEIARRWS